MTVSKMLAGPLADLLFGVRDILADNGAAPSRPTIRFVGADYEDDPDTGTTIVTITGEGGVRTERQIIAGPGLLGGGDLTADRTLSIRLRGLGASGLGFFDDGDLGVVTNRDKGTFIDDGDLAVAVVQGGGIQVVPGAPGFPGGLMAKFDDALYGPNSPTMMITAHADGGMVVMLGANMTASDGLGVRVRDGVFAPLVGGKTRSNEARGKTLRGRFELKNSVTATMAIGSTHTIIGTVPLGACTVGEEIVATFQGNAGTGGAQHVTRMRITNSATPDLSAAGGASVRGQGFEYFHQTTGNIHNSEYRHTVTVAENLWLHVMGRSGGGATWIFSDKEIFAEIYQL